MRDSSHVASLDGIRAISMLLVFVAHAGLDAYVPGGFGVTMFFFLSGFLITTLLRQEYDRSGDISIRNFVLRRILRIWPPFYIVLLFALAAMLLFDPGALQLPAVIAQLLHISNYWLIYHGNAGQPDGTGVYWSLGVEEHFYLAFPWLYLAMRRFSMSANNQARMIWGVCLAVLAWRCILVLHFDAASDRTYMGTDTRIDSILFGCALATWHSPVLDRPALTERSWKLLTMLSAIVLLGCLLVRNAVFRETLRYSVQGIALTCIFVAAIRFKHWSVFAWLNTKPMTFLGTLSFSMYLVHFSILKTVGLALHDKLATAAISLLLTIVIASVIHVLVEKPCATLRRRLHQVQRKSKIAPEIGRL